MSCETALAQARIRASAVESARFSRFGRRVAEFIALS
jgi:hypothetical protein